MRIFKIGYFLLAHCIPSIIGGGAKWVTFGPFLQSRSHISKNMELIDPVSFLNMHDRSWEQIKLIFAVYGKKICRY